MSKNDVDLSSMGQLMLPQGEGVLYVANSVKFQVEKVIKHSVNGSAYVTNKRVIFMASKPGDLKTFSMPLSCLHDLDVKQPIFGANEIVGKVDAMPDGGFEGTSAFKMAFSSGGAIEFANALKRAFSSPNVAATVNIWLNQAFANVPPPIYTPTPAGPVVFQVAPMGVPPQPYMVGGGMPYPAPNQAAGPGMPYPPPNQAAGPGMPAQPPYYQPSPAGQQPYNPQAYYMPQGPQMPAGAQPYYPPPMYSPQPEQPRGDLNGNQPGAQSQVAPPDYNTDIGKK